MWDGEHLALNELLPDQPRQRYEFIQSLERNWVSVQIMFLTYSSGNNVGNLHFVWKLPPNKLMEETFQRVYSRVIEVIKPLLTATISHTCCVPCHALVSMSIAISHILHLDSIHVCMCFSRVLCESIS